HAAVMLLPPLGPRPRTGALLDAPLNDGVAHLLRAWARAGFVVMRVDPAGVGDSEGPSYADAELDAEIDGYRAGLAALASLPFVRREHVFLFGHSLGGVLAPLVSEGAALRGIVVHGTTSRRWSECLAETARRQLALAGCSEAEVEHEAALAA